MTYRYEFDEMGGYDCMYGAFRISGPDGVVVEVDLQHHGQESCDYKDEASKAKAEVFAKRITDALNGSGEAEGVSVPRELLAQLVAWIQPDPDGLGVIIRDCDGVDLRKRVDEIQGYLSSRSEGKT
jgi:hypothetical protein